MQITITNDAFYIIMGLLFIAFLPHIYLCLIFAIMTIADLLEYIAKLLNKFINLSIEYIFPIAIIFLFYLAIIHVIGFALKSILGHV
jgi:hypothetical protein